MGANAKEETKKQGAIESFMGGCKTGVQITLNNIMPAMVLGYVVVQFDTYRTDPDVIQSMWAGYGDFRSAR